MSNSKDIGAADEGFVPSKQDLALIDQQLEAEAAADMKMAISRPTGNRIKAREDKKFQFPDGRLEDAINVIPVDFITYHRWYRKAYVEGETSPPVCFAFGKAINDLSPHNHKDAKGETVAPEPQADACMPCPWNQWESHRSGGKGKDCQQRREVAVILEEDLEDPNAPLYLLSISPTGVKSFDMAVSAATMQFGAPIKAVMHVTLNPTTKYATMVFSDLAANPGYAMHVQRRAEARNLLEVLPDLSKYVPTPARPNPRAPARGR
jgi:hypothetical protein